MKTLDNEIKKKTTERRKMQKKDDTKTKTKKANQIINMTARKTGNRKIPNRDFFTEGLSATFTDNRETKF